MLENLNISSIPLLVGNKRFFSHLSSIVPACLQAGLPIGRQVFHYFGTTDNLILKLN